MMSKKEKQEKKRKRKTDWLAAGLLLSMLASALYMCCYRLFQLNAENMLLENPLESRDVAEMLVQQSYVLYHDLQQKQSPEDVDYLKLYVKTRPDCGWVLDEKLFDLYLNGNDDTEHAVSAQIPAEDRGAVYNYLYYLKEEYFADLENYFPSYVAYSFDYYCIDRNTGVEFGSLGQGKIDINSQYFYLALEFDEYGNCEAGDLKLGKDPSTMRKYVNVAARTINLETETSRAYQNFNDAASADFSTYFTLGKPVNCEIVYCISNAAWKKYESGESALYLKGGVYDRRIESHYYPTKIRDVMEIFFLAVFCLGVLLPASRNTLLKPAVRKEGGESESEPEPEPAEKPVTRWLRLPPEVLAAVGFLGSYQGISISIRMVLSVLEGSAAKKLAETFGMTPASTKIVLPVYYANFLGLTLLFFFAWYIGVNLRDVRGLGIWAYIRERSLIYRFFPYMRSKIRQMYDAMCHFDLTKKSNKMIIRIVAVNGVILCLTSALWIGGWGFAVIYSLLLYLFLRKYVSDLQKKYALLLQAANEIAEGRLNVQMQEDLGVFEPFKPQIYRIQEGFKRAVEEEVKSQRMKAELITNVSHDLKTPLTAIITYVNLLKEPDITQEQRKEYLDTLERKALRLKALIEDLFEVSKANSQSMTLNLMDVDVMNLIKQAAFEMGDKFTEKNLDLRMAFPDEKVLLRLDSQRTYRVYENLFANIAKYAMPGTRVYVNGFQIENSIVITLKNIAAEEITVKPEELTERFVRGDAARNTEGSGLGLAIAKSFVELQGGTLEIDVDGDLFKVTTVWSR